MSNPGGASISTEQLKARYIGTGKFALDVTIAPVLVAIYDKYDIACLFSTRNHMVFRDSDLCKWDSMCVDLENKRKVIYLVLSRWALIYHFPSSPFEIKHRSCGYEQIVSLSPMVYC